MYHKFNRQSPSPPHLPGRDDLIEQLRLVQAHHTAMTPHEHLQFLEGAIKGKCPVVLTVDDGYADFWEVAYPVFRDAGVPVMLFVTMGFVSCDLWFWWDRLRFLLDQASPGRYSCTHGNLEFDLDMNSPAGRERAWHEVADHCRFMPDADKEKLINDLAAHLGVTIPSSPPEEMSAVTWDQVREMARNGILFGAHTVNHPVLTRITPEAVRYELVESKTRLENELNHPVTWFCYPQGGPADYNKTIRDQVAGLFNGAYVAFQNIEGDGDPFTLPRYGTSKDLVAFRWALCGAEYLGLRFRKFLGLHTGVGDAYWYGSSQGGNT